MFANLRVWAVVTIAWMSLYSIAWAEPPEVGAIKRPLLELDESRRTQNLDGKNPWLIIAVTLMEPDDTTGEGINEYFEIGNESDMREKTGGNVRVVYGYDAGLRFVIYTMIDAETGKSLAFNCLQLPSDEMMRKNWPETVNTRIGLPQFAHYHFPTQSVYIDFEWINPVEAEIAENRRQPARTTVDIDEIRRRESQVGRR